MNYNPKNYRPPNVKTYVSSKTILIPFIRISVDIDEKDITPWSMQKSGPIGSVPMTPGYIGGSKSTFVRRFNQEITLPVCNYAFLVSLVNSIPFAEIQSKRYDDYNYVKSLNHEIIPSSSTNTKEIYDTTVYLIIGNMFANSNKKFTPDETTMKLIGTFWIPFEEMRWVKNNLYYSDYKCLINNLIFASQETNTATIWFLNSCSGIVGGISSAIAADSIINKYSPGTFFKTSKYDVTPAITPVIRITKEKANKIIGYSGLAGAATAFAASTMYLKNYYSENPHYVVKKIADCTSTVTNRFMNFMNKIVS